MEIIQRGIHLRFYRPRKPIICPRCGCIFEVKKSTDVIWSVQSHKDYDLDQMIVNCPNSSCKFEMKLSSEKIEYIKLNIGGPWNDRNNQGR